MQYVASAMAPKLFDYATDKVKQSMDIVQPDSSEYNQITTGRSITIYQETHTGMLPFVDIANFRTFLGGMFLKGYNCLRLEAVEVLNGFTTTPLYGVGIFIGNTVSNCTLGSASMQYGGITNGGYQPSFMVLFDQVGGITNGNSGSWIARWEGQKEIDIRTVNTNYLDIILTDQTGKALVWDGTTACNILLQFTAK